ncbi:hypothetical protein K435DRAFT_404144 [Dendrothele bispora CBS 962.96]|uniref:ARID domain-containing protein n=1 Tax=Dendrothele bispora (strain CBS 962.96) TaxID=1314807 RepID=A0A4S8L7E3_DENBC|nr:hypothetical protein K435DRAFT_404144 [Dendrothele bispora CBS 962.96]
MQSKDLWAVIGARMGFVQFPGGHPNDLPKSGPAIAQQLAHVYKEYLAAFDTVYNGFQHSSRDPEQYDQQTSGNDQGTEDAYDRNTDGQTAAEDPPSNPTNTEHSGGISRGVGGITGRYTEQDNRRIIVTLKT